MSNTTPRLRAFQFAAIASAARATSRTCSLPSMK